jgi:hypothetical protein
LTFLPQVEPFQRALSELKKEILITGRRQDQGNVRISLDVWEDGKQIFNPLAKWEWSDITGYCDQYGVPVNERHGWVFRAGERNFSGEEILKLTCTVVMYLHSMFNVKSLSSFLQLNSLLQYQ